MRKTKKDYAKKTIDLLDQAQLEIKRTLEAGKDNIALSLLEQCQEAAIELGNFLEKLEGEGFATIPLLEEYCENLFLFYEEVQRRQKDRSVSASVPLNQKCWYVPNLKSLHKSLIAIENSVKNDIKVRKEVVFLPYKASMWDALESIWDAACKDPDCDAYVVPIPYYDKNQDGSFGQMHYEGELYPDYVPIVRYDKFNLAEHQPDMIFIHNPYDESNYVTSVHPFFYSVNLKRYTDCLVYVPYFTLKEVDPEDQKKVEKIEHFCMTPGVIHAHKVIVQSENMRNVYISVLTNRMGANTRKIWEEKILGLGSPKYDRVIAIKKEELEIPDEWMEIIKKPDGTWKKIILYNTGVSALLQHDDHMLKKMENVFEICQKNKEEMALLWRPHPLIKATICSMRPRLWKRYESIVQKYQAEGWGIYDDSADVDRALVLSDAYYGDGSSLTRLFSKLGKPVMIQNVECLEE